MLEGPKRGRPLPKVLSADEVDRLLGGGAGRSRRPGRARRARGAARHACTACSNCSTRPGLRVSELMALPRSAAQLAASERGRDR